MKAIIVDDQKSDLYNILDELIIDNSIEYKLFTSPTQALKYVTPDIGAAFLDVEMPEMNGIELAKKLILINPSIKLIFITGYSESELLIKESFKDNLFAFINKPFNKNELEIIIKKLSNTNRIKINMFGTFDIFINNKLVEFSSSKSKELLALLIVYRGKTLTKDSIIDHLYPDKDYDKADSLYRHARCKLISTLEFYGISHLVTFQNAKIHFNSNDSIDCDYYNHIDNISIIEENDNDYNLNVFLKEYDWACEYFN